MRRQNWSSPAGLVESVVVVPTVGAVRRGAGAEVEQGLVCATLGAGRVLVAGGRAGMMKRTPGRSGVFLGASGRGVSKSVAVGTFPLAVRLGRFLSWAVF